MSFDGDSDLAPLPSGYERWTLDTHGAWLALPSAVISSVLIERQVARHREVAAVLQKELEKGEKQVKVEEFEVTIQPAPAHESTPESGTAYVPQPATPTPSVGQPAWHSRWGAEAPAGRLRVLHQFDELKSGALLNMFKHRSADTDNQSRLREIFKRLIDSGPDRACGHSHDARVQLEALEQEMPHFRAPLRLLSRTLALAEAARRPVRIPPMLLLGPPGVGKTHLSQKVAEILGVSHATIGFDKPSAGSSLCGSDSHWGNSSYGILFEMICLGEYANPVILLDEIDKAASDSSAAGLRPLNQLHGALEPVTSRRMKDQSLGLQFDASLVTYIATANHLHGIETSILSRFEIFVIEPPQPRDAVETARCVASSILRRLGLQDQLTVDRQGLYLLAHLSPRQMQRTVEKAAASAIAGQRERISEPDLWAEIGLASDSRLH